MSEPHAIIPISDTCPVVYDPDPPSPNVYPLDRRTQIATAALSGILSRVDGKLPVQAGDIDRFVAGAASLAVKAADALIKELSHNNRSESP